MDVKLGAKLFDIGKQFRAESQCLGGATVYYHVVIYVFHARRAHTVVALMWTHLCPALRTAAG